MKKGDRLSWDPAWEGIREPDPALEDMGIHETSGHHRHRPDMKTRGISLRIITWNCNHGTVPENVSHFSTFPWDVMTLQEVSESGNGRSFWYGRNPRKGHALVHSGSWTAGPLPILLDTPYFIPFRVQGPAEFNLFMIWARKEMNYIAGMEEFLETYDDFIRKRPSVIMGDFNSNATWDEGYRFNHSTFVDTLSRDFGLVSAYHAYYGCGQGRETHPTFYHRWNKEKPYHIDYCFVPEQWRVMKVRVGSCLKWCKYSDHCPLMVDIELPRVADPPGPGGWSP